MKQGFSFLIIILIASCSRTFNKDEICGNYSPINYTLTSDTIQIRPNGLYHRKIYDRKLKLVLEQEGHWSIESNSIIHFDSYFFNLDRDVAKFPELLLDTVGGGGGESTSQNGIIEFCVGYYRDQNCYQKVK